MRLVVALSEGLVWGGVNRLPVGRQLAFGRGLAVDLDDDLCLCFHVTKRKVINFLRITQPRHVGQLSECFGAGTGCGWCRPYLRQLFDQARAGGVLTEADCRRVRRETERLPADP